MHMNKATHFMGSFSRNHKLIPKNYLCNNDNGYFISTYVERERERKRNYHHEKNEKLFMSHNI